MAYTANTPQPTDKISQTQPLILDNFQTIATAFNLNHGSFNDPTNQGKHEFLQMPEQGAPPTTAVNEGGLYAKEANGTSALFWRNESNGTEQQMTNSVPTNIANSYAWSFSDGLQIRFGSANYTSNPTLITFSTPFSAQAYSVFITPIDTGAKNREYNAQSLTVSSFAIHSSNFSGGLFYYLAIGR